MWEANRKHKLKRDAIPTIFGFFVKKQVPTKDIENDGSTKNDINEISNIIQSGECTRQMKKHLMTIRIHKLILTQ